MICKILTVTEAEKEGCQFEEWDKGQKKMRACGARPIAMVGRGIVCIEHLPDALVRCGSGAYVDEKTSKGTPPQSFWTKEGFLGACKCKDADRLAGEGKGK